jgi:MoxR domain in the MoxR-vWA-beta-propeller ternary systems
MSCSSARPARLRAPWPVRSPGVLRRLLRAAGVTKFSTPEELFGPISLRALEQDRFSRVISGKLPEAEFALVDEIFKANSAILNSLLTLVNERIFHNDGSPIGCPLVTLFGASNELPDGKELEALFDRFLLRFDVGYLLRPANLKAVMLAPDLRRHTSRDEQQGHHTRLDVHQRRDGLDGYRAHLGLLVHNSPPRSALSRSDALADRLLASRHHLRGSEGSAACGTRTRDPAWGSCYSERGEI